jgi:cytochrome c1
MNMILNPQEMVERHPVAKQLLAEHMTYMPNQGLTEEQARQVLEYLRTQGN